MVKYQHQQDSNLLSSQCSSKKPSLYLIRRHQFWYLDLFLEKDITTNSGY